MDFDEKGIAGYQVVQLPKGISVKEAVDLYKKNPDIELAEPDYKVTIEAIPNDPGYSSLWGLGSISAPQAWDLTTGSSSVIVAVIDTGVDYNHADLAANIWTNTDEIPGNGIDDDHNGYIDDVRGWNFVSNNNNPMDDHNHGTHCAGTISAVGNNGIGVTGVAWNVKIMPLKFLDSSGSGYTSAAAAAILYANANGASVLSNSWGGGGYSSSLYTAIQQSNGVVVCAAGNSNSNNDAYPMYPSSYNLDNIISVAAGDSSNNRASFSSYGLTSVDVAAPGVSIYSTTPGSSYGWMSGTSMATPHTAGVAALVKSRNPSLTNLQVKQFIMNNVDPLPAFSGITVTGGKINAYKAVNAVIPPVDAKFTCVPGTGVKPLTVQFNDLSTGNPTSWQWNFGEGANSTDKNPTHVYANAGTYTVTLTATNGYGSSTKQKVGYITVTPPPTPVADFNATPVTLSLIHI